MHRGGGGVENDDVETVSHSHVMHWVRKWWCWDVLTLSPVKLPEITASISSETKLWSRSSWSSSSSSWLSSTSPFEMNPLLSESSLVNSSLHKEFHDHDKKTHRRWRWRRRRWWWRRRRWWCEKYRRWRELKTWSSARPLLRREERSRARRTRIDRFPCFRPCRPAMMMMMMMMMVMMRRRRRRRRIVIDRFPCSRPCQPAMASIIYISTVWSV